MRLGSTCLSVWHVNSCGGGGVPPDYFDELLNQNVKPLCCRTSRLHPTYFVKLTLEGEFFFYRENSFVER
jgi:hypothetical protein